MTRRSPPLAVLALLAALGAHAQPAARDERDLGKGGTMSVQQLRREPITFQLDIPYTTTTHPRHRLDLYLPRERKRDKLPVIVFFHGGGWVQGDKSDGAGRLMPLLRTGQYAGISAGYRLSGDAQWPAQVHDAKAAIRWVRANAARHGLDPERIGVWGRSAGGHLVLMLGASGGVPELEGDLGPHPGVSSKVAAVANFFGVSELMALLGQPSDVDRTRPDSPEALLLGGALPDHADQAKAASPITYVSAGDAPVLTVHGTADRTVPYDQAVRLDAALRQADVPSYFVAVRGAGHGDFGTLADGRVDAFFGRYLRGEDGEVSTAPIEFRKR